MFPRNLKDAETLGNWVNRIFVKDYQFDCEPPLDQVLAEHKRLVCVYNHGSTLGWLSFLMIPTLEMIKNGGADRLYLGIVDHILYKIPIANRFFKYFTNTSGPLTKPEIIETIKERETSDLYIMPEGAYCNFGELDSIRPFRSNGFLDIAVKTGSPLLLLVHDHTDDLKLKMPINEFGLSLIRKLPYIKQFDRIAEETRLLNITLLPRRTRHLRMKARLYVPDLTVDNCSDNRDDYSNELQQEADKVRAVMETMLDEMKQEKKQEQSRH